jgi:PAS domain-containing protein
VSVHSLELQLATALQRFNTLQRRAQLDGGEASSLVSRSLHELERALEEVRVAQEQLIENRSRMDQLQAELTQQYRKYWELFDEMRQAYVVTRSDTTIVEANKAAAELLNVSQRFLIGKTLSVFVCENRTRFLEDASSVGGSAKLDLNLRLRPRERAPMDVSAQVSGSQDTLRWILRPASTPAGHTPEPV